MSPNETDDCQNIHVNVSQSELQQIIRETVNETLGRLGIYSEDAREMQKDMLFVRRLRATNEKIQQKTFFAILGAIVTAFIGIFLFGIITWIRSVVK